MWFLGCVVVEFFLGLLFFFGVCDFDMLLFMREKFEYDIFFFDLR